MGSRADMIALGRRKLAELRADGTVARLRQEAEAAEQLLSNGGGGGGTGEAGVGIVAQPHALSGESALGEEPDQPHIAEATPTRPALTVSQLGENQRTVTSPQGSGLLGGVAPQATAPSAASVSTASALENVASQATVPSVASESASALGASLDDVSDGDLLRMLEEHETRSRLIESEALQYKTQFEQSLRVRRDLEEKLETIRRKELEEEAILSDVAEELRQDNIQLLRRIGDLETRCASLLDSLHAAESTTLEYARRNASLLAESQPATSVSVVGESPAQIPAPRDPVVSGHGAEQPTRRKEDVPYEQTLEFGHGEEAEEEEEDDGIVVSAILGALRWIPGVSWLVSKEEDIIPETAPEAKYPQAAFSDDESAVAVPVEPTVGPDPSGRHPITDGGTAVFMPPASSEMPDLSPTLGGADQIPSDSRKTFETATTSDAPEDVLDSFGTARKT